MRIAVNIVSSYARFLLGMIAVFCLTPFILQRIGIEDFGLWSLCLAVTGVLGVLDLGFSTAAVKYVAECAGNGKHEARNEALSTLLLVYTLLGGVVLILVLAAIPAGIHWFGLEAGNVERFRTIVTITGVAQAIALPLSIFRSALVGQGRYDVVNSFDIGIIVFNIILVITLLTSGMGLPGLALANASIVLAGPLALVPMAFKKIPGLALSLKRIRMARLREAAPLAVWFLLANIALIITLRSDALLIKIYLPLTAVAAFAIAAKISESSYLLNKQFSNALMPLISSSSGAGDTATVRSILQDGTRYLATVSAPCREHYSSLGWSRIARCHFASAYTVACRVFLDVAIQCCQRPGNDRRSPQCSLDHDWLSCIKHCPFNHIDPNAGIGGSGTGHAALSLDIGVRRHPEASL
jgi:O-antigen/teichoic acid export membrane protein